MLGLQCLVHWPAYSGITTVVMSGFKLENFCSIIQDHKITYTFVAPPIIVHLAKNPIVSNYDLSSVRMITSGAAPLTKELIYAVKDRLGTVVKQAYGLSETSPVTHIQVCFYLSQPPQLDLTTPRNNGTTASAPTAPPYQIKLSNSCLQTVTKSPPEQKASSG